MSNERSVANTWMVLIEERFQSFWAPFWLLGGVLLAGLIFLGGWHWIGKHRQVYVKVAQNVAVYSQRPPTSLLSQFRQQRSQRYQVLETVLEDAIHYDRLYQGLPLGAPKQRALAMVDSFRLLQRLLGMEINESLFLPWELAQRPHLEKKLCRMEQAVIARPSFSIFGGGKEDAGENKSSGLMDWLLSRSTLSSCVAPMTF
ncbi:MAG: hypothetical protein PHV34_01150 [Verrucomicrobiae bacterium]|nr:hypothetical protein [Verrucomicrobiae bacterium]